MPPKYAPKERSWGSRYDTLTSVPTSPAVQRATANTAIPTPHSPANDLPRDGFSVPSTPATLKPEKIGHDSSIFVGSLPSGPNVDHGDLTRDLNQHLASYPEVKSIKVVRDSKGGVCAFVQCKDAATADALLRKLQEPGQPDFMGRQLRYEPARAFRTLLISYRTPRHLFPSPGLDQPLNTQTPDCAPRTQLHEALRILLPENAKHCAILYDTNALEFKPPSPQSGSESDDRAAADHPLKGDGLLISPLKFDSETLRTIVSAFGPIEYFGLFDVNSEASKDGMYAAASARPHYGMRSEGMDSGIFEVKWEHREDCMNAALTLRNVPHLVVTWAHRSYTESGAMVGYDSRFASPVMSPSPRFPTYPRSRTQSRSHLPLEHQRPPFQNFSPAISGFGLDSGSFDDVSLSPGRNWAPSYASPTLRGPPSPLASRPIVSHPSKWSSTDFPPLHGRNIVRPVRKAVKPLALAWAHGDSGGNESEDSSAASLSPTSSLSAQPATPNAARPLSSPPEPSSPTAHDQEAADPGQDLSMPPTPDFTTSSITPITPKIGHSLPRTPPSIISSFSGGDHGTPTKDRRANRSDDSVENVDPLCIWVGGLDESWSEAKLKAIFSQYGQVVSVKLIQPRPPATTAFAFINYTITEAGARAVAAEDKQTYGTRAITVRLRELSHNGLKLLNRGRIRSHKDPAFFVRQFPDRNAQHGVPYSHRNDFRSQGTNYKIERSQSRSSVSAKPDELEFPSLNGSRTECNAALPERPASSVSSVSPSPSVVHSQTGMGPLAPYPTAMHPQPWMQQYPPHCGYPTPYPVPAPYMGYPAAMPQYHYGPTAGNETTPRGQHGYSGPGYPYKITPKESTPHDTVANSEGDREQAQLVQPPLKPAALYENEHGGITALYPPDALNQYLANAGSPHSQGSSPEAINAHPQPSQTQPHPNPGWGAYPQTSGQVPVVYPYAYGPAMHYAAPHGGQYYAPGPWLQSSGAPSHFMSHIQQHPHPGAQQIQPQALPPPQTLSTPPPYLLPPVSSGSLASSSSFQNGHDSGSSGSLSDSRGTHAHNQKRFGRRDQAMGHGYPSSHSFHPGAQYAPSSYPPRVSPGRMGRGIPAPGSYGENLSAAMYQHAQMRQAAPYPTA